MSRPDAMQPSALPHASPLQTPLLPPRPRAIGGVRRLCLRRDDGSTQDLRVRVADGFRSRLFGLMLQRRWPADCDALLLTECRAVHMAFMRLELDVVYLDALGSVVGVVETLRPWRASVATARGARHALELAAGSVQAWRLHAGDRLLPARPW